MRLPCLNTEIHKESTESTERKNDKLLKLCDLCVFPFVFSVLKLLKS